MLAGVEGLVGQKTIHPGSCCSSIAFLLTQERASCGVQHFAEYPVKCMVRGYYFMKFFTIISITRDVLF